MICREAAAEIGYTAEEFLPLYTEMLDYILEVNRRGAPSRKVTRALFCGRCSPRGRWGSWTFSPQPRLVLGPSSTTTTGMSTRR